jgi:hypothetical protein
MDHQIDKPEAQESSRRDIALRPRNQLPRRRPGERLRLASRRLDHGSDRILTHDPFELR